jgi:diguanylate cyclase (GGDEF)-like protein
MFGDAQSGVRSGRNEAGKRPFRLTFGCRVIGAGFGACVGLLVLLGYVADFEPAWRLTPAMPATHPNTALCTTLLGYGLWSGRRSGRFWRISAKMAVLAVTGLLVLRLASPIIGTAIIDAVTPFQARLAAQAAAGTPISLGVHTAVALLAVAVAEILRWLRRPTASQIFAGGAIGIAVPAIVGYLDGVPKFYGAMAPLTLLGTLPLAAVVLFARPKQGFMRALTAPLEPGRLARLLLGMSTGAILFIGLVVSRHIDGPGVEKPADDVLLAYQTASIVVLTWVLVTIGTVRADRIERRRRSTEQMLVQAATKDALTGLLGRRRMEDLRTAWEREWPRPLAAKLSIDLDRFRSVNEAFGPVEGDKILIETARRLQSIAGEHHVGRVGGDEFAIFCVGVTPTEAERIAAAVTAALSRPFEVQGRSFHLSASVGVAHASVTQQADLRQAADDAMYVAKHRGGNQAATFERSMQVARQEQVELEQSLHEALGCGDALSLVYQPVVRVRDRTLIAVEALARWTHPRLGAIEPDRFVPLAEATGLIIPLCWKLMTIVVRHAADWHVRYPGRCPVININVPSISLASRDMLAEFTVLLKRQGLDASCFCLEVTERAFTDANAVGVLEYARRLGFNVAMDDFGVGYSSLSQLPRLPLVSVKLDRSFVVNSTESVADARMLSSVVQLAHGLDLQVVAEGVENQKQLDLVSQCGVDAVQGYLFSYPLTPGALGPWLSGPTLPARRPVSSS